MVNPISNEVYDLIKRFGMDQWFDPIREIPFKLYSYRANEVLFHEGDEIHTLLFLVEGKLKISTNLITGKSLLLRFCNPPSVIGDIEFISRISVKSQVAAVSDCVLLGLDFDYLRKHEMNNAKLLHYLLLHLSHKLQTCTSQASVNLLSSVENRFASYLLSTMLSEAYTPFTSELQTSKIGEISGLLGTTHRHLNRTIQGLCQKGILERGKDYIRVLDWTGLQEMSNGILFE
ncbi:Crp/Fnr family transcriptional regulator [Paenibacillus aquistagni]|uniref:Crp/Fnr family transcriptional regulator n=1 Tax=Paenibacillus aquistagni TaxID=1852522 RepID=UPI00145BA1D1|nr:cyclic nucleotide-binding domain-containing protein [Paenibacillus aquistagni]NMM54536.1 cyclic nucleotide-binding domain-containing protein [Paenibacillus aquistagni]